MLTGFKSKITKRFVQIDSDTANFWCRVTVANAEAHANQWLRKR